MRLASGPATLRPMAKGKATRSKPQEPNQEDTPLPFEKAIERLSAIVLELEGGDLSLEESLQRFEEGVRLAKDSQQQLDQAEAKVEKLLAIDDSGNPVTEELEEP